MKLQNKLTAVAITLSLVGCGGGSSESTNTDTDVLSDTYVSQITATVDSEFVYEYEKTKYVPPEGKILYIMGQDIATISQFSSEHADQAHPAGWSAYWTITDTAGIFENTASAVGSQTGYHNHQWLADEFDNSVIQSALWMVGKYNIPENILAGEYDQNIEAYCDYAKSINRPIYLRIGYEFDGIHNTLDPEDYVASYRYIYNYIINAGVTNVAFVWHSYVSPTYNGHAVIEWYPGDDYVDWFGVSLFAHMYSANASEEANAFLQLAKEHKKPVMVAESAPVVRGVVEGDGSIWGEWYANYFNYIINKNIKAFSYINCDWNSYPGFKGLNWGDSRIETNEAIEKAWMKEVAKDRYLKQSPNLYRILGYSEIAFD